MSRSDGLPGAAKPGAARTRRSATGASSGRAVRVHTAMCLAAAALLTGGCVEVALVESREPFDYGPVASPEPARPTEGAVWPGDTPSGSFLFFDSKARGVGDLLTVLIVEDLEARGGATTELESESTVSAKLTSDIGLQKLISAPVRGLLRAVGIDDPGRDVEPGTELTAVDSETESSFEGEGQTERRGTFDGVITCRIVDVLPGDVFHIRGRRALVVNHEMQYVTLEGLVRREDISLDNTVPSTVLAEARLTYDGLGVVDDKQRPGVLSRVLSWIYPL